MKKRELRRYQRDHGQKKIGICRNSSRVRKQGGGGDLGGLGSRQGPRKKRQWKKAFLGE